MSRVLTNGGQALGGNQALLIAACLAACFSLSTSPSCGSVCSAVRLELSQDVTMERQGFVARMEIQNGLADLAVENVGVTVSVTDAHGLPVAVSSDPENVGASFFLSDPVLAGVADVSGSGRIGPGAAAAMSWTLIPAPGAGGINGSYYLVGARLGYDVAGTRYEIDVMPATIQVSPLPELELDFFLPGDVSADDPLTLTEEPALPFSIGMRVRNTGIGIARDVRMAIEPPLIVHNELGLNIAFAMEACHVDGAVQLDDLNVRLQDLEAGAASVAEWRLTSSLSGHCTNFGAAVEHADALGGQLTALIRAEDVHTHPLRSSVVAESFERDGRVDFLCADGVLYESSGSNTMVATAGTLHTATHPGGRIDLSVAEVATEFFHASTPLDGAFATRSLSVTRSDGTALLPQNVWVSGARSESGAWEYAVHLFDISPPPASYRIESRAPPATNLPPCVLPMPILTVLTNQWVALDVRATDPEGQIPSLAARPLPAGSTFADDRDGSGTFAWRPAGDQAGSYRVTFTASDGEATGSHATEIRVLEERPGSPSGAMFILR